MWHSPLLPLLLLIDITLISIHFWLWFLGKPVAIGRFDFDVTNDRSVPEMFGYLKWLASAAACAFLFSRRREPLYLVWAGLFSYFLFDDSQQFHERAGRELAVLFGFRPALLLRPADFGEVIVSLTVGAVLFGLMAFFYWRADDNPGSRNFTRQLLPWLGLLIFFGVIVDLIDIQLLILGPHILNRIGPVAEDGGEMILASVLTAISVYYAMRAAGHAPP